MTPAPGPAKEPRWNEVTALFGGTFDPPHLGHREALDGLFTAEPGIARALILPAASPPHKPTVAKTEDRVAMARLAFAPAKLAGPVEFNLLEIERAGPSYSFDTIAELGRHFPSLAFVLGTDQLAAMAGGWHRFPELLGLCHWLVLARKPDGERQAGETLMRWSASGLARAANGAWALPGGKCLRVVSTPARELSSTAIREAIARTGQPPENSVDSDVLAYLKRRGAYGMKT